jgi:gamma-glutamyl-gamma-aminobutyrate hydrolase PuuD/enamine deaminase RidA (YjgF/YER057c/UK114 family)
VVLVTADVEIDAAAPSESVFALRRNYCAAIEAAGGLPLILPCLPGMAEGALALADGVVVAGTRPGHDAHPDRRAFEQALIRGALAVGKPVLGVCNGMQTLGEVLGGRVDRDDPALLGPGSRHLPRPVPDAPAHAVALTPGSRLAAWAEGPAVEVNSLHRHALRPDGRFLVAARAEDGVVEAIEGPGEAFCLGVQWHPEYLLSPLDARILAEFVRAAGGRRPAAPGGPVSERLAALGLALPEAPEPPGAFVGAVRHGSTVTVSGQVPLRDGGLVATGTVGAGVSEDQARDCARQAALNALAQLDRAAGGLDRVRGFVRLAGYVAAAPGFTRHGNVVDAASELLRALFPDRWRHARVAVGVASLPRGAPVEVELSAVVAEVRP